MISVGTLELYRQKVVRVFTNVKPNRWQQPKTYTGRLIMIDDGSITLETLSGCKLTFAVDLIRFIREVNLKHGEASSEAIT